MRFLCWGKQKDKNEQSVPTPVPTQNTESSTGIRMVYFSLPFPQRKYGTEKCNQCRHYSKCWTWEGRKEGLPLESLVSETQAHSFHPGEISFIMLLCSTNSYYEPRENAKESIEIATALKTIIENKT